MNRRLKNILIYTLITICSLVLFLWFANFVLKKITKHGVEVETPVVKGLDYEEAKKLLEDGGFRCLISDSLYIEDAEKNEVIEQEPKAKSMVKPGRMIYLKVNCLEVPQMEVGDYTERTLREAESLIANSGFKIGKVIERPDKISDDYVIEQLFHDRPVSKGTKLPKGSLIDLVVLKKIENKDSTNTTDQTP